MNQFKECLVHSLAFPSEWVLSEAVTGTVLKHSLSLMFWTNIINNSVLGRLIGDVLAYLHGNVNIAQECRWNDISEKDEAGTNNRTKDTGLIPLRRLLWLSRAVQRKHCLHHLLALDGPSWHWSEESKLCCFMFHLECYHLLITHYNFVIFIV